MSFHEDQATRLGQRYLAVSTVNSDHVGL